MDNGGIRSFFTPAQFPAAYWSRSAGLKKMNQSLTFPRVQRPFEGRLVAVPALPRQEGGRWRAVETTG